jgi:hypothetical protein
MLNEVKFKAKTKDTREWVFGFFVKYPDGKSFIYSIDSWGNYEVDEDTLCQSTNEVDIDFRELFVGDMVNDFGGGLYVYNDETGNHEVEGDTTRIGIIVFEEGRNCIRTKEMNYSYNLSNGAKLCDMQYYGNIYD